MSSESLQCNLYCSPQKLKLYTTYTVPWPLTQAERDDPRARRYNLNTTNGDHAWPPACGRGEAPTQAKGRARTGAAARTPRPAVPSRMHDGDQLAS